MNHAFPQIPPMELTRRLDGDPKATVLDVRSPGEYRAGHIPGARLLPVDDLEAGNLDDVIDAAELRAELALPRRVILLGNPNVGKSVLFNALTGLRAVVSNYPGTTVEVTRGRLAGTDIEVIDSPGLNSILPLSEDERVTWDLVRSTRGETGAVVVQVADAKNLRRSLALALQIASAAGGNIFDTGKALDKRIAELEANLPAGIEVHKFAWQSDLVVEAIDGFVVNLAEAVLIVLVVLALAMGWRMGVIIGWALVLTILGTFIVLRILDIELHRVSLGALVVALGMMVDNAIVVADNYAVRLKRGMKPVDAAIESASQPSMALLGATVVAVMAFYPVFASVTDGGEYGRTLFIVVAIALLLSWLIGVTVTPMNCIALLRPEPSGKGEDDPYGSGFFRGYRSLLEGAIRFRLLTIGALTLLPSLAHYLVRPATVPA